MGKETSTYAEEIARKLILYADEEDCVSLRDFEHAMKKARLDPKRSETKNKYLAYFSEAKYLSPLGMSGRYHLTEAFMDFLERSRKKKMKKTAPIVQLEDYSSLREAAR